MAHYGYQIHPMGSLTILSLSCLPGIPSSASVLVVEDWFNTYLDYLQYVSWCTNVWFMFMHVDVTIGCMTFLPSTVVVKGSHRHTKVENSRFCLERHYWAEVESVKQKELSSVNRRTVVNDQHLYSWVYAVHCLRTEPRYFAAVPFVFSVFYVDLLSTKFRLGKKRSLCWPVTDFVIIIDREGRIYHLP